MKLLLILLLAVHSLRASLDDNASIESAEDTTPVQQTNHLEEPLTSAEIDAPIPDAQSSNDEIEPSTPVNESPDSEDENKMNVVDELMEEAEDLQEPDHSSPSNDDVAKEADIEKAEADSDALPTVSDEEQIAKELAAEAEKETEQPDPELLQELQELQTPVESVPTATGATATMDRVIERFELQETWALAGGRNRGYGIIIENGSDKDVCGVTFMPNSKTIDLSHLSMGGDGSLSTKGLNLAPEGVDRKFGYISSDRSLPTIIALNYC